MKYKIDTNQKEKPTVCVVGLHLPIAHKTQQQQNLIYISLNEIECKQQKEEIKSSNEIFLNLINTNRWQT